MNRPRLRPNRLSRILPSIPGFAFAFATALSGCGDAASHGGEPEVVGAWPGASVVVRADGLRGDDTVWSAADGTWQASGAEVRFPAPAEAGGHVLHGEGDGREATVVVRVRSVTPAAIVIEDRSANAIRGRRGDVTFEAHREEATGAVATFTIGSPDSRVSVVTARIVDGTTGTLTIDGVVVDGYGELDADQARALRTLGLDLAFEALALVPLDLACEDELLDVPVLAALVLPWQAVSKYETADRRMQITAFERASRCRHLTAASGASDPRPSAVFPLLANAQPMPAAFGHLPFDAVGALPAPSLRQKSTDVNVYGPGGSICRGACGPDCEERNCGEPEASWRCEQIDGRNTGDKIPWLRYTCGEHPGCIEHDGCFDACNDAHGAETVDAALCMRVCDVQAISGYGALQGLDWALGRGPFTHERSYDYVDGEPVRDEALCPPGFGLWATPSSGRAPLGTTIHWEGPLTLSGACTLDPGDGSAPIVVDPCTATGDHAHDYAVPSALRSADDVYTATLSHGGVVVAQGDVQATWSFAASVTSGPADLTTSFSWDGLSGVAKQLTCVLDFGDQSPPQTIEDCANAGPTEHTYGNEGTYLALLTVNGESRSATKFATIVVTAAVDGFVGIARLDEGAFQAEAHVTWTQSEDFDGVVQYLPTGSVTYSMTGCTVTPSTHAISPDDGYMEIDVTYDPHRYYGGGVTSWAAVLTCGEQSYDCTVIAQWFEGSAIYEASPDGDTLAATHDYWSWSFDRTR